MPRTWIIEGKWGLYEISACKKPWQYYIDVKMSVKGVKRLTEGKESWRGWKSIELLGYKALESLKREK